MSEQEKKQIQELLGMIFTVFNLIEQRIDHINIYYNKEESSSYCKMILYIILILLIIFYLDICNESQSFRFIL